MSLCTDQLIHTLKTTDWLQQDVISGRITIGDLATKAWGTGKGACYKEFGEVYKIGDFVQRVDLSAPAVVETWNMSTSTLHASGGFSSLFSLPTSGDITAYLNLAAWGLWALVVIVLWIKLIQYLLVFLYDVLNAWRTVYLRIILPRGDDKISREQDKDVAKDMKEKLSRMGQVYEALHKLGHSSLRDTTMNFLFRKPKVTTIWQYEKWLLHCVIWVYPEYRRIVESAVAAQFPDASIEMLDKRPSFFSKKYSNIAVMEQVRSSIYPIKTFKQMSDDPINDLIDTMGKMSTEDTFSIVMPLKPAGDAFNRKAKKWATGLYRRDEFYVKWGHTYVWKWFIPPYWIWALLKFLIKWVKKKNPQDTVQTGGKDMVRMTKAEEDALNIMGEEAGKHAFDSAIFLISSSDNPDHTVQNINNMEAVFTIYRDEFNNELDNNNWRTDALGFFFKPLWKFAARFWLCSFFFKKSVMTPNALTSLFHMPDGIYNRSPIIKWLDYKMLAAPDNLPKLKDPTEYVITWAIAEQYMGGKLEKLFENSDSWAVASKEEEVIELVDYVEWYKVQPGETIVESGGKKHIERKKHVTKKWLRVFKDGVLLGINVYRNTYTPIYMLKKDRTRHYYIVGKSGTGKSVFIDSLARQDIWAGNGCCVIDPHGDLVESILQYIPKERAKDVVYFDAGNEERPMGLNLYEISSVDQSDRIVNDATEMFLKMFGPEIFGPRIQEYFKYGSLTLLEDLEDPATLIDVPRLFTDETYRDYKVKKVKNPVVRNFREKTYNAIGDREKQEIIPYFTSKFVSFITNSLIRNIIGQTKSAFNFRQIMDEGKILLVNLSKGKIGELNAQLLGMILVSNIYNAAMSRQDIDEEKRRDFYLYVDEFQNFVTNTFADILSEARKYKLSLIMAHQYIAQLDGGASNNIGESSGGKKSVKDAVFGNVGTMQSFKIGAPDAEFLEKEYAPVLSAQDIVWIANYKAYIKLNINNSTSRVFSMNAINTTDYQNKKAAAILQEYSAKKYGRKKEFVEAEIEARLGILASDPTEPNSQITDQNSQWNSEGLLTPPAAIVPSPSEAIGRGQGWGEKGDVQTDTVPTSTATSSAGGEVPPQA